MVPNMERLLGYCPLSSGLRSREFLFLGNLLDLERGQQILDAPVFSACAKNA